MNRVFSEIKYQIRYSIPVWLITILTMWMPDVGPVIRFRGLLISLFLPGRPKGLTLGRDVTFLSINRVRLGGYVYIAKGAWINGIGGVDISDEVVIAPYVVMSSNNHGYKNGSVRFGGGHPAPIFVGRGTWLAAHVVVAAGVKIAEGNLVAANSVVTKSTKPNSVMAGVPAVFLKTREDNPSLISSKHDLDK